MRPYFTADRLRVQYGDHIAIHEFSLSAARGEFLTLLGPSGCGKTTFLRAVAGFAPLAGGSIIVDGKDIAKLPAHKRNVGLVFQSYALFPHLTVVENVAFGLRMRHVASRERKERAMEALVLVGLSQMASRYPSQLSGGQQQRVALARALVIEPAILLLDEPLSNLDPGLRVELRQEIRALQRRLGIMTILVTHDLQEALAVSDFIVVMNEGRIVDRGTPQELYDAPSDGFAAAFMGARTVISGVTRNGVFEAPGLMCVGAPNDATSIVLRGARIRFQEGGDGDLRFQGRVAACTYLGDHFEADVETLSGRVRILIPSDAPPPQVGREYHMSALPGGVTFLSPRGQEARSTP